MCLVVFGITGDLARQMTFLSLYRLEARGLLDCPIVGVAFDDLRSRAARRAHASRSAPTRRSIPLTFERFAARLSYVQGDFADAKTFGRLATRLRASRAPVFYLEVPPSLFATVARGLHGAKLLGGRARRDREAVRPRSRLGAGPRRRSAAVPRREPDLPRRPLPRQARAAGASSTCASPTRCSSRSGTATTSRTCRSRWPRASASRLAGTSTTRSARCATSSSTTCCSCSPPRRWRRPRGRSGHGQGCQVRVFRSMADADPKRYVRGQYDGYTEIAGVAKGSTTETYAALRLEIDNWRWAGVPFFIRTGKRLFATETELRLVFKDPPRLGFIEDGQRLPEPSQLIVRLDPDPGIRIVLDAQRADDAERDRARHDIRAGRRGGGDALRGAPARRPAGNDGAVHAAGQRRRDLADHPAAARGAPADRALQARILGTSRAARLVRWRGPWVAR